MESLSKYRNLFFMFLSFYDSYSPFATLKAMEGVDQSRSSELFHKGMRTELRLKLVLNEICNVIRSGLLICVILYGFNIGLANQQCPWMRSFVNYMKLHLTVERLLHLYRVCDISDSNFALKTLYQD
jgi:hypothetical protein